MHWADRPKQLRFESAILILLTFSTSIVSQQNDPYEAKRKELVNNEIIRTGITNQRVIQSLMTTQRHEFVPRQWRHQAYFDMALPIGESQTISSPFIVAYMTECLDPQPTDRVLEIGTGSGFQAAVLSPLVADVYSIEIVESLGKKAASVLKRLNYKNVHTMVGDGFKGWPEYAPFDKIIVTCSPEKVPQPLIDQLKNGGMMVVPVGERYQQTMYLMKKANGKLESETLRPTLFVPMTGQAESKREITPDPDNPSIVNGSFEVKSKGDYIDGWYYTRQATVVAADDSPDGEHHAVFENRDAGRGSRVLQGLAINGKKIRAIQLSAWGKTKNITAGPSGELPRVIISFYDEQRRDLGQRWLGPWRGTTDWTQEKKRIRVPENTREAIVRVGLLGASGWAAFDDVKIEKEQN